MPPLTRWFLKAGILFVVLDALLHVPWLSFLGRAAEILSLISFAIGHWKRIKPIDA